MNDITAQGDANETPTVNPELSEECLEESIQNLVCDNIGNTVYSKKWVIQTVMKLLEKLKEDPKCDDGSEEIQQDTLDENLEIILCNLWDMTIDEDVGKYLCEVCPLDVLLDAITSTNAPRLMEICTGILGNLACHCDIRAVMVHNKRLQKISVAFLHSTDPPTLTELMRLFEVLCSNADSCHIWIKLWDNPQIWENVMFIMSSSVNRNLLKHVGKCVDCVLDSDDHLKASFANQQLLNAVLDAINQIGYSDHEALEGYLHMLHLFPGYVLSECAQPTTNCCISYLENALRGSAKMSSAIPISCVWKTCSSILSNCDDVFVQNLMKRKIIEYFAKSCTFFLELNALKTGTCDGMNRSEEEQPHDVQDVLHSILLSAFEILTLKSERLQGFLDELSSCAEGDILSLLLFVKNNGLSGKILSLTRTEWNQKTQKLMYMVFNYFGNEYNC